MIDRVAEGLEFPEGPRWHDGRLFFSDMLTRTVHVLGPDGALGTVCSVPARPSGLGFPSDGRMLVVSMDDHRLLRLDGGELAEVADMGALADGPCNDMVAAPSGRAWVGDTERLLRVDPDGSASVAAEDLRFPNGVELTDGGATLLVAESLGMRVTAPALVVWGEDDRLVSPVYAREFADRLGDARVEIVPGAGHVPQLERLDVVGPMVLDFLA